MASTHRPHHHLTATATAAAASDSQDGLIVYSSNIFAIMGLRSLYTLVAKAVQDLPYLRPAVALVLVGYNTPTRHARAHNRARI